jgi:trehalose synthase
MVLKKVRLQRKHLREYREVTPPSILREIERLAPSLRGARIFHLNATPKGGGVAEMLATSVALLRDCGIDASWYVLTADPRFFGITKSIHNFLQGKEGTLDARSRAHYLSWNRRFGEAMERLRPDLWVVHDPQPAAAITFLRNRPPMVLRMHIDTSHPNRDVLKFFLPFLVAYDRVIFTLKDFVPPRFPQKKLLVFTPVIDPTTEKNRSMTLREARGILLRLGMDPTRPILTQVSRFDPWKDPLGVLEVFRRVRRDVPGLQLAYVGVMLAQDDPEALAIVRAMRRAAGEDRDVHLFWDRSQLRGVPVDRAVNAFQTASDVILQKSTREGFGMTVTEAMWKGRAVVGGDVGGIRIQIVDRVTGYRVSSLAEAARRVRALLDDPKRAARMGLRARERVRQRFLMPRLIRDELRLYRELLR